MNATNFVGNDDQFLAWLKLADLQFLSTLTGNDTIAQYCDFLSPKTVSNVKSSYVFLVERHQQQQLAETSTAATTPAATAPLQPKVSDRFVYVVSLVGVNSRQLLNSIY